ncbi:lipopolysaccharide export system permease protein [Anseongella ginsenosidimutans]|uniref:Lipopolysaccharide export system permease protein n=1 Tax=Anseongella ginsenosidimutans TaxID=496056 RepID=A0A4R3KSS8_9SPHI|nr:LptF/LptG family permease [Anseongella ginsenosidimutans]QEC53308.1 YjgP/YjgQ family permease [Anseongella ginsenosidimutans]TCS88184.1 lipopolysaccharide export system permease protein [Anseongella ginsenosidimutans]
MRKRRFKIPGISLLDRYIIKRFLGTFFLTLAIFMAIAVVFDISEKMDDFLKWEAPVEKIVVDYYLNFVLFYASFLSPFLIFVSVILFTAKMANDTEVVAILSGGISYNRFLYPYFLAALFLAAITFVFNGYVIPPATKTKYDFEMTYEEKKNSGVARDIHMQLDAETFAYVESFNIDNSVGYKFSLERFEGQDLRYKLMADRILWDTTLNKWLIEDYSIRYIDSLREKMIRGDKIDTTLAFSPSDFDIKDDELTTTMTMNELEENIRVEKIRGTGNLEVFQYEYHRRFASPFTVFILVLIGVSLSSRKSRGGVGASLGLGIGLSFLYVLFMQFASVFSIQGNVPPVVAAWLPNVIFGSIAYYLYRIAPK